MDSGMPAVGAVVLGWNHRDDSRECIDSILRAAYPLIYVWYVDNGSTDDAPAFLRKHFPEISVLALGENKGLVGGYNAGIEAAREKDLDYVCVFNNDVVVQPSAFQGLVDEAESEGRAGLLVPRIVLHSNEGILWSAGARRRVFPPGIVQRGLGASARDERYALARHVEYATSCAWMMRTRMVEEVGLFSPNYPFYYSDYDYCRRVSLCDWQIRYVPDAIVKHKVSLSTQRGPEVGRWWHNLGAAEARFYRQYESRALLALHAAWIVLRAVIQSRARYIVPYLRGLWGSLVT